MENGFTVFSKTIDNLKEGVLRNAGVSVILLDSYYEMPTGLSYIYIQGRVISGILFVQRANAKLLDTIHSIKKRRKRK